MCLYACMYIRPDSGSPDVLVIGAEACDELRWPVSARFGHEFGVVFAERGVVFGAVLGLCSANAVRQTRLVFGKRLCSACVRQTRFR